jgi:hypothetical protein
LQQIERVYHARMLRGRLRLQPVILGRGYKPRVCRRRKAGSPLRSAPALHRVELNRSA